MTVFISSNGTERQIDYIREELNCIHWLLDTLNAVHDSPGCEQNISRCISKMESVKKSVEWRKQFLEEMVLKEIPKLLNELENNFKGPF